MLNSLTGTLARIRFSSCSACTFTVTSNGPHRADFEQRAYAAKFAGQAAPKYGHDTAGWAELSRHRTMTEGPRYGRRERGTHAQTNNAIPSWWPARRGAQRARRQSQAAGKRGLRAQSDLTDTEERADPDRTYRHGKGLARRGDPESSSGLPGQCLCSRVRSLPLVICATQWRRAGR